MKQDRAICRVFGGELTGLLDSLVGEDLDCSIRVHGGSMDPFLCDGDVVKISSVSADDVCVGDIVAVAPSKDATPLVHRVIGCRVKDGARELLIKGDRCVYNDGWVLVDNVLGMVCEMNRDGVLVVSGTSKPCKYFLAVISRLGILHRCLSFSTRIRGRYMSRGNPACGLLGILLFACFCSFSLAQNVEDKGKGDDILKAKKGRSPLVVLKQVEIQGQVFLIADKDGKQLPAKKVKIQVNSIDTKKNLFKTTTDDTGKYKLPNFDIGRYQFYVGRLKLELEITKPQKPGKRVKRISKKVIVFIPESMK